MNENELIKSLTQSLKELEQASIQTTEKIKELRFFLNSEEKKILDHFSPHRKEIPFCSETNCDSSGLHVKCEKIK